jgi:hypothetical protein
MFGGGYYYFLFRNRLKTDSKTGRRENKHTERPKTDGQTCEKIDRWTDIQTEKQYDKWTDRHWYK